MSPHNRFVTSIATAAVLLPGVAGFAQNPAPANPAAPNPPEPTPAWVQSAALGLTLTRGNSKTMLFTGNYAATAKTKDARNELNLGADVTYGEAQEMSTGQTEKNAESEHAFAQYNRLFTDRFFGYFRVDALHDAIADVDYRFTLSPGVGYYFIKNERTTLRGEVGPGYIFEKLGGHENDYAILRIAERLDHKLNERARIWESVEFLPQVDRFGNYLINAEVGIDTSITKRLSLRVFLQDTYKSEPAPDRLKNDLKLVSALAYKF